MAGGQGRVDVFGTCQRVGWWIVGIAGPAPDAFEHAFAKTGKMGVDRLSSPCRVPVGKGARQVAIHDAASLAQQTDKQPADTAPQPQAGTDGQCGEQTHQDKQQRKREPVDE